MKSLLHIVFILLFTATAYSGTIEGMVADSTSENGVPDAIVSAWIFLEDGSASLQAETGTDESGKFLIENLPSGQYYLTCHHPDFRDATVPAFDLGLNELKQFYIMLLPDIAPIPPTITGYVYSTPSMLPALIPLDGAMVYLTGRQIETQTETRSDGSYRFDRIPTGKYLIWAAARGHQAMAHPDTIEILDNTGTVKHDLHLVPYDHVPPVFLEGAVFDASITINDFPVPVYPATITLNFADSVNYASYDTIDISVTNNPDGSFEILNLTPAIYDVKCTADGYYTEYIEELDLRLGPDMVFFYMTKRPDPPENYFSGHIFNALDNNPVHNATVSLTGLGPYDIAYVSYTNEKGMYEFKSILPGKYELRVVARGFNPSPVDIIEIREDTFIENYDIKIWPVDPSDKVTLHGFVYNGIFSSLKPVYPAYISLTGYDESGDSLFYYTQNNEDGSYKIPNIVPGRYTVQCTAPDFQPAVIRDFPLDPPEVELNFMLLPMVQPDNGWISGKVKFDHSEQPVAGAIIQFISENGISRHTETGNDGQYKAYLPVGEYYVSCVYEKPDSSYYYQEYYNNVHSLADATPVFVYPEEVTPGIDFGIPLPVPPPSVIISGIVTDNKGYPLREALVRAVLINPPYYFRENIDVYQVWTDEYGKYKIEIYFNDYTFANIVYGFVVSAEKPGYKLEFYHEKSAPYLADILWTSVGMVFRDINFTLDPVFLSNSISGTVISESGNPIGYTFIIASNANTGEVFFTYADRSGGYTLDALPAGYYYILFTAPGHIPEFYKNVWMWEDATPVLAYGSITGIDAKLSPFLYSLQHGTLAGIVKDMNANPVEGALICIQDAAGEMINYGLTDDQGSYSINGLNNGLYLVQVSKVGYGSVSEWIEFDSSVSELAMLNINLDESVTGLPEPFEVTDQIPTQLELLANYPNPFNPETKIQFGIPESQDVHLAIYDVLGRKIRDLMNSHLPAGRYDVIWNGISDSGQKVSSGVYFYILFSGNQRLVKKMILSK